MEQILSSSKGIQKQKVLQEIEELDIIEDQRLLSEVEAEIVDRASLMVDFENTTKHEEVTQRQRSRALWLNKEMETPNSLLSLQTTLIKE